MKLIIDTDKDPIEKVFETLRFIYQNNKKDTNQTKIPENTEDKTICAKCNCKLFEKYTHAEAQKIINYCNIKYKGKTYCKDCQKTIDGGASA